MWEGIARTLPQDRIMYGKKVYNIDLEGKVLVLEGGTIIKYKHCISTMPLDYTLQLVGKDELAKKLAHTSSHIVGIGMRGQVPKIHSKKCWIYFPESTSDFYRCSLFSNYSEHNCPAATTMLPTKYVGAKKLDTPSEPRAGPYWSLMFEVSESKHKPVDVRTIFERTIAQAIACKVIAADAEIVSLSHSRVEYGYPVPTIDRDAVLEEALTFLKEHQIWSRGRFGGWKYEVSNQDHSVLIGAEAVDNVLFGTAEVTHSHPGIVAKLKNVDLLYTATPYNWTEDE